jgi:predicted TIM-barrel fold metal-dependent hydrolase
MIASLNSLDVADADKTAIFGGNAARLYRLG